MKFLTCKETGCEEGEEVSDNIRAITCWRCVAKTVAPPTTTVMAPVVKLSSEEKAERKEAKAAKKAERLEKAKVRGRGRGWHLKFLVNFDGQWFSKGKPIDEATAFKMKKAAATEPQATPTTGKPRGWHLKKAIEIDGQWFSKGKPVTVVAGQKLSSASKSNVIVLGKTTSRGRGWHRNKKFQWEGKFYSMGKEITKTQYEKL